MEQLRQTIELRVAPCPLPKMEQLSSDFKQIKLRIGRIYDILNLVAKYYEMTVDQMMERTRLGEIVEARSVAMFIMRMNGHKLMEIGNVFLLDHTTVLWNCNKIATMLQIDKKFRAKTKGFLW